MLHEKCPDFLQNSSKIFQKLPFCSHAAVPTMYYMNFLKLCEECQQHQTFCKTSMHLRLGHTFVILFVYLFSSDAFFNIVAFLDLIIESYAKVRHDFSGPGRSVS